MVVSDITIAYPVEKLACAILTEDEVYSQSVNFNMSVELMPTATIQRKVEANKVPNI
jgi:hypothetical protein